MVHKRSSHLGVGFVAGTMLGVAAALFLKSPKGKRLTKTYLTKGHKLHAKLMAELGDVEHLTKEKYEKAVDQVLAYYAKTREIAKTEVPEIRDFLLSKWTAISKHLTSVKR